MDPIVSRKPNLERQKRLFRVKGNCYACDGDIGIFYENYLEKKATARKFLGAAVWGRFMKTEDAIPFEPISSPIMEKRTISGLLLFLFIPKFYQISDGTNENLQVKQVDTQQSGLTIRSFRIVSVLGRGHFGKVIKLN